MRKTSVVGEPGLRARADHRGAQVDSISVHEVIFPLGPRQLRCLHALYPRHSPRTVLAAMHRGVLRATLARAEAEGASPAVLAWLRLADQSDAADYLTRLPDADGLADRTGREILARWGEQPIGDAYCDVLPPDLRHRLGEYYTPPAVVGRIMQGLAGGVVADPACGDGRFLVSALAARPENDVWGCDLNPLAVAMSRYEVWRSLDRPTRVPRVRIQWRDFLLNGRARAAFDWPTTASAPGFEADHFVGNPPWVLWRNLSAGYRGALAEVFGATALHQARGWGARVSAGQTDLAHLFVHESLQRVAPSGTVTYILPRSVFKSPIGPSVIRSGRTTDGRSYGYTQVIDLQQTTVFDGVRLEAVVARAEADRTQEYPVRWVVVNGEAAACASGSTIWVAPFDPDDERSGWVESGQAIRLADGQHRAHLVARGGINTGGGNGVFHVDVLETARPGSRTEVRVRNRPVRGFPDRVVELEVERFMVRPLLKGSDISAWQAAPSMSIVLPHDPEDLRRPLTVPKLRETAPRILGYLESFREELSGRKELARWGGEWYSLFRIGPYTAAPWRVVWPTSAGRRMRAAVLPPTDATVPDQKVVLVPFDQELPAHFLCALLNSDVIRRAIRAGSGLDASPNLTRRLPFPRWNPANEIHRWIADYSRKAHAGEGINEQSLNGLVSRLYR